MTMEFNILSDWGPTSWNEKALVKGRLQVAELVPVWLRGDEELPCSHVLYLLSKQAVRIQEKVAVHEADGVREFLVTGRRYRRCFVYRGRFRLWYTELQLEGDKAESPDTQRWPWVRFGPWYIPPATPPEEVL